MSDKLIASIGSRNMLPLIILPLLLTFLFTNLLTNNTYAAASLTVSGDAIINLSSLSAEGAFAKSGNIDITASTDSPSGYKLMIQANNSTSLVSGSNSIASLDPGTSISEETFRNGSYNGKWGFKPSMFNSIANSNFLPSPSTTGDVINATACANGTGSCPNEDNYTIAIGAKVNNTQPIGTYANTFNIMMVSNGIEYSITYRNTKVSNMPEDVSGETEASTVTLASETPTRDGYNFLGWCTVQPAVDGSCSGTSYSPGQQISTSAASNLSLYARWGTTSTGNTIATATYMQDVTSCPSSLPTGTQYTLTDKRDGKTYTAAKQADGKCWMTQNLNLSIGGEDTTLITSENTNLNTSGSGAYAAGYKTVDGVIVWTQPSNANPDRKSIDERELFYSASANGPSTYNWNTAIASNNSFNIKGSATSADNDVCPKGWRLPIEKHSGSSSTQEIGQLLLSAGVTSSLGAEEVTNISKATSAPLYLSEHDRYLSSSPAEGTLLTTGFTVGHFIHNGSFSVHVYADSNDASKGSVYYDGLRIDIGRGHSNYSIRCVVK